MYSIEQQEPRQGSHHDLELAWPRTTHHFLLGYLLHHDIKKDVMYEQDTCQIPVPKLQALEGYKQSCSFSLITLPLKSKHTMRKSGNVISVAGDETIYFWEKEKQKSTQMTMHHKVRDIEWTFQFLRQSHDKLPCLWSAMQLTIPSEIQDSHCPEHLLYLLVWRCSSLHRDTP